MEPLPPVVAGMGAAQACSLRHRWGLSQQIRGRGCQKPTCPGSGGHLAEDHQASSGISGSLSPSLSRSS